LGGPVGGAAKKKNPRLGHERKISPASGIHFGESTTINKGVTMSRPSEPKKVWGVYSTQEQNHDRKEVKVSAAGVINQKVPRKEE